MSLNLLGSFEVLACSSFRMLFFHSLLKRNMRCVLAQHVRGLHGRVDESSVYFPKFLFRVEHIRGMTCRPTLHEMDGFEGWRLGRVSDAEIAPLKVHV